MKCTPVGTGKGKRAIVLACLLIAGIAVAAAGLYVIGTHLERAEQAPVAEDAGTRVPGTRADRREVVEYDGVSYALRQNLTSILIIGVDKGEATQQADIAFRSGGQADYLTVLVIDDEAKVLRRINIDRDTVTDITVLSALGKPKGTRKAQISLSHGYGADREQAAQFTHTAVQNLLLGIEIDYYLSFSMDAITAMNDLVGGVTVPIEEDLTAVDAAFLQGSRVTLAGEQAELYVRARKDLSDGTNLQRMSRQNAFMAAFFEAVAGKLKEDVSFVNRLLDTLEPYNVSSMRRGYMVNETYKIRDYQAPPPLTLQGERSINAMNNMEFHPDEASLHRTIIDVFYEPLKQNPKSGP